jgi:hypothetical protein
MSHDHLRCGHRKMRRRDTNRTDGMILDVTNLDGKIPVGKLKNSGAMNSDARMV